VGLLLVGEKKSGAFYSDEDVQLLQTLGNQAALALTNARAYEALRRAQEELVQAERMAAVGELSATVAHGIRNPLAGIRAAAQFAREEVDSPATMQEGFDDIIAETDRLERRIRAILDLARPFETRLEVVGVEALLRDFIASVRTRIPAGIDLSIECAPDLPRVEVDVRQLNEVLDALVVNAVEAMGAKGKLCIRGGDGKAGMRRVNVTVDDTGPGIEPARLGRIFDLFYTTKASGTGVGLAMARRLLERQGGRIEVASVVGEGTTFTLSLPVAIGRGTVPGAHLGETQASAGATG
jgi:signal transduction histidine kinase